MNCLQRMSVFVVASMMVVACGSDGGSGDAADPTDVDAPDATITTDASDTTDAPSTTDASGGVDEEIPESSEPVSDPASEESDESGDAEAPVAESSDDTDDAATGDLASFCERSALLYTDEADFATNPTGAAEVLASLVDFAPDAVVADAGVVAEAFRAIDVTDELAVFQVFDDEAVLAAATELEVFIVENCESSVTVDESENLYDPEEDGEIVEGEASIAGMLDFLDREYRATDWRLRLTLFEVVGDRIGAGGEIIDDDALAICSALADYASGLDSIDFVQVIDTSGPESEVVAAGEAGVPCSETVPPNGEAGTVDTPPADLDDPVYDPFGFDDEIDPDEASRLGLLNFFDARYTDASWRTSIETSRSMGSEVFGVGLMGVDPKSDDVIAVCDAALEYFARFGGPIRFEVRTFESGTDIGTGDEKLAAIGSLRQGCSLVEG